MATVMRSKFRGCLLGVLIGDCIGSPFEGESQVMKGMLNNFFSNLLIERNQRALQIYPYTDDTAMTKCVAESLIEQRSFNPTDMARRFTEEYFKSPRRGYGNTVIDIFSEWNESSRESEWNESSRESEWNESSRESEWNESSLDVFGPARRQFNGTGSLGNGAAMRIAPVALFASSLPENDVIQVVKKTSTLTHTHPYGVNGAILQCLAIRNAVKWKEGKPLIPEEFEPIEFLDSLITVMKPIEEAAPEVKRPEGKSLIKKSGEKYQDFSSKTPFTDKLVKMKSIVSNPSQGSIQSSEEIAAEFGNSVSALGSVPSAIYSVIRAHSDIVHFNLNTDKNTVLLQNSDKNTVFLKTLFDAISFGGDTDTIASMACSITGALYGEEAILPILKHHCESYKDVEIIADKLFGIVGME